MPHAGTAHNDTAIFSHLPLCLTPEHLLRKLFLLVSFTLLVVVGLRGVGSVFAEQGKECSGPGGRARRAALQGEGGEGGGAGVESAVSWLLAHEGDPRLQQQVAGGPAPPSATLAGVAGLLRREQEAAASAERCEAPSPVSVPRDGGMCLFLQLSPAVGVSLRPAGLVFVRVKAMTRRLGRGRTMEDAFRDLRGLMAKAGEMVQLAARFRGTLGDSGSEGMDPDMAAQLITMGIQSPVTRDSAGALFHQQLARQVRASPLPLPLQPAHACTRFLQAASCVPHPFLPGFGMLEHRRCYESWTWVRTRVPLM